MTLSIIEWLWYRVARLILDHRFTVNLRRTARRAGGIGLGFLATEPVQVVEEDESHWWSERLTLFFLFWAVTIGYRQRIIPHSPIQHFK